MIQTVEVDVDEHGRVMLAEPIDLPCPRRAWVTIVDEEPSAPTLERSLLTDKAIAEDWNRPEEDAAWAHLHEDR